MRQRDTHGSYFKCLYICVFLEQTHPWCMSSDGDRTRPERRTEARPDSEATSPAEAAWTGRRELSGEPHVLRRSRGVADVHSAASCLP